MRNNYLFPQKFIPEQNKRLQSTNALKWNIMRELTKYHERPEQTSILETIRNQEGDAEENVD